MGCYNLYVDCCSFYVGFTYMCCCGLYVGFAATIWAVVTSMWAVTASMWDVTAVIGAMLAVTASIWALQRRKRQRRTKILRARNKNKKMECPYPDLRYLEVSVDYLPQPECPDR